MPSFGGAIRGTTFSTTSDIDFAFDLRPIERLDAIPLDAKTPLIIDGIPLAQREVRQHHARTPQYFFRSLLRLRSTRAAE